MPILKQFHDRSVSIPNATAQHKELSITALGVLVRMSSYSDNFRFRVEWLQQDLRMGREKIQSILRELRLYGFLKTEAHHDGEKLDGQTWWVSTIPQFINDLDDDRVTAFQSDGKAVVLESSGAEKPEDIKKEEITKKNGKEKKTRAPRKSQSVEEVTAELQNFPAYSHINVAHEVEKAKVWLAKHPKRRFGWQFMVNWLNRIEPPVSLELGPIDPSQLSFSPNGHHIPPAANFYHGNLDDLLKRPTQEGGKLDA